MKPGLPASISRLVNGEQRRSFCFANGFSSSLESILFNGRYLRVFRCHQSSRTFSSCSEDAFEELGPPSEGLATQFKLRTQKPERHLRHGPKKALNRSSSPLGSRPSISSIFPTFNKPSKTSKSILQELENVSGQYGEMKNRSKSDSCSVTAEDVTDGVDNRATDSKRNGPKKELNRSSSPLGSRPSISSIFPKLDKPSKTSRPILQDRENVSGQDDDMTNISKLNSCSVTADDVTDGVDNRASTDYKTVAIRIQDIAKETTYHIIHSICKSVGVLEGLAKTEDAVDVFFRVNNDTDSQNIVKRLNGTVIDESHWSAHELPMNSTSSSSSSSTIEDVRCKMGIQINNALFDLKQQLAYKKICCEDLEFLHMSVMHLEGWPTTIVDGSYKE